MLEVKTSQQVGLITFNYEEVKKNLEIELRKYDVVVTEETIKDAKELKATLNKVKKQVDDERKRIKKEYCQPLTEFENQVKDLVSMLDKGYRKIDDQIKVFDEAKKEERRKEIEEEYQSLGISHLVPFNKIFNPKWTNASTSKKEVSEELVKIVNKINQDIELIEVFRPLDKADAMQVSNLYLETLDIGLAKAKSDELIALRKQAQEEAQKEAAQEEIVAPEIERVDFKQEMEMEFDKALQESFDKPKMKRVEVILTGSFEFFDEMNQLVKKYNVQCKVLKKEVI